MQSIPEEEDSSSNPQNDEAVEANPPTEEMEQLMLNSTSAANNEQISDTGVEGDAPEAELPSASGESVANSGDVEEVGDAAEEIVEDDIPPAGKWHFFNKLCNGSIKEEKNIGSVKCITYEHMFLGVVFTSMVFLFVNNDILKIESVCK